MYDHLIGRPQLVGTSSVVLLVGGVGYALIATAELRRQLIDEIGRGTTESSVPVRLLVGEKQLELVGFASPSERLAFDLLIGVPGIGPKVAMAVLEVMTPGGLRAAIETENVRALSKARGVSAKGGQKICLALSGKVDGLPSLTEGVGDCRAELRAALLGLGFSQSQAQALADRFGHEDNVELALKRAMGG